MDFASFVIHMFEIIRACFCFLLFIVGSFCGLLFVFMSTLRFALNCVLSFASIFNVFCRSYLLSIAMG